MSKREASMFAAQGVDVDAPRAKRQKTAVSSTQNAGASGEMSIVNGMGVELGENEKSIEDLGQVKERGLKLWQTIKDAKDKDNGRQLSLDFLRLPSKRQYPDYYEQIKRPIALDDIKKRLESGQYAFFEEIRADCEQCFKNAKKYNMKESQIWRDAKHLHKLVNRESSKLTGVPAGDDDDVEAAGEAGSDNEDKKKKAPNMSRLLKTRLQKLVDKTDDNGRVLSAEFMELPNKKQWAIYYRLIKKPQCLENIFKRLKRKEYHTPVDFANDVELVFSNALEFNQEHTEIWEDAIVLRDHFRQLMADLPPPFTIPAYASSDHSTKVKLKIPQPTNAQPPAPQAGNSSLPVAPVGIATVASPRPIARAPPPVPAVSSPVTQHAASPTTFTGVMSPPAPPKATPLVVNGAVVASPAPPVGSPYATVPTPTPATQVAPTANTSQPTYGGVYSQHYPAAAYRAPVASTSLPNSNSINPTARQYAQPPVQPQAHAPPQQRSQSQVPVAKSPTPAETGRPLRHVSMLTKPAGRKLVMDYRNGVKIWAARLGSTETSLRISNVKYVDDDDSDAEDGAHGDIERHEEEEDDEEEEEPQPQIPQKRGRGRPRKKRSKPTESPKGKGKAPAKPQHSEGELQVRLNGIAVSSTEGGVWEFELPVGSSVVEVGAKGGMTWRAYLDRIALA
ncbi:uncharacterized protein PHACADRAFT_84173 [Phanerochaete carnosa HHB-10118-sp]|uniref:Bromo domain-containing protein n=1 Tax=Phanerochaete carnosa (strain HHB-10118-sp) TaxID=650164 RepID=K5WCC5_PHACS|nr:uncharacterized protein PHACADRAFT_84173 [Phanerochaete carnosa HHB-10118-sp]EKM61618.1 hypothetical protein PHACADRAFT_84173 [Phanerochaete carnosa HHB-10118-sp]